MIPFHIARPQGCDIQTLYKNSTWTKPPGVSHVYMMLIGGGGNSPSGGGSGAVTVWYGAAQHVPDNLVVSVSTGDSSNTTVNYYSATGLKDLLTANGAVANAGATAMTNNEFGASGFFNSTAGQSGTTVQTASATTFLSGGQSTTTQPLTANYGYSLPVSGNMNGFFMTQPVIVGVAGKGNSAKSGIGCGSGGGISAVGGPGLVLIASW